MPGDNFASYFKSQQVALQWLPVLRAMASELSANADAAQLEHLFIQIGTRFAEDVEGRMQDVKTLSQLEETINSFMGHLNWGWVDLQETNAGIEISHHAAPLAQAFGEDSLTWSVGLLQGFYQRVFEYLDTSDTMEVSRVGEPGDGFNIQLIFGRKIA